MGVDGCWCAPRSSKPLQVVRSCPGGFDSHILSPTGTGAAALLRFLCISIPRLHLHSEASLFHGGAFWRSINTAYSAVPLRGAIVSMGLRGSPGGLRGEIEIFHGPWQKSSLSRPWQQLSRSFAKIAQHKHERSCYEQPQRGKAGEQAYSCICAERKFNFNLRTFCQVCAEG